jgi:hypothetical protein
MIKDLPAGSISRRRKSEEDEDSLETQEVKADATDYQSRFIDYNIVTSTPKEGSLVSAPMLYSRVSNVEVRSCGVRGYDRGRQPTWLRPILQRE